MARITIDIDDRYSSILSVTCIGQGGGYTNVHTHCFDVGCKDHHYVQKETDVLNKYGDCVNQRNSSSGIDPDICGRTSGSH